MIELDPGHKYSLSSIDGEQENVKTFVKREGVHYPGNIGHYPGCTLQESWRADIKRLVYVNKQIPCAESTIAINLLRQAIYMLEARAKRVRNEAMPDIELSKIEDYPPCKVCGHIFCTQHVE